LGRTPTVNESVKLSSLLKRKVIFGYREDLPEQELDAELKVENVGYLTSTIRTESIERTGTVVIIFNDAVPENIQIGFLRFKVKSQPIRCVRC